MEINILGPLEITPPSRPPGLQRIKERCLLAILAINTGEILTPETLILRVWDDDNPSGTRMRTLQSYLSHVRDAVTDTSGEARLESAPGGYRLRLDRECVDLHRFWRLRDQSKAVEESGEAEHAASLLRAAEELWRGPALAGLPGQWVAAMRYSLEEDLRAVTKKRLKLELDLGRHGELTGELQRLAAQFPLDEQYIGYQMTALYRSGRQAEALALFQDARRRFGELGIELNPGLAALFERVLRHDPELVVTPARRRAALLSRFYDLPPRAAGFVGRTAELTALTAPGETGRRPLIRIIEGTGGVGKTALAVETADRLRERYPDPPVYLNFHSHQAGQVPLDANEALRRLLERVGIPPASKPRSMREMTVLWQQETQARRSVIILDDVPGRNDIAPLLPRSGECLTLVTTRRRMTSLPGSTVLDLGVLPEDDAVVLFKQTAGLEKADDPAAIVRAVRLCSCLPLAVTVTAGGLRDGGPTVSEWVADIEALRAIPDGFGELSQQLASTFELSYEGLGARHQQFFRRLAINPCPDFSVRTAAIVVGIGVAEAKAALTALYDRHLVEQGTADRFRFHDLVRWFALFVAARDDPSWERRRAERRLLDYYLQMSYHADRLLYPHRMRELCDTEPTREVPSEITSREGAQKWLELEWRNVLKVGDYAAKHEWKQYCADLASALAEFLEIHGHWNEGVEIHRLALGACRDINDEQREAKAAGDLSLLELRTGNYQDALLHADEALRIRRSLSDSRGEAELLDRMGTIHRYTGRIRDALAHHQEAFDLYSAVRDEHGMAEALCHAGIAYSSLGRFSEAVLHYEKALRLYRGINDKRGAAKAYNNIGDVLVVQGFHRDAMVNLERSLELFQEVNAKQNLAILRHNLGCLAQAKGRVHEAMVAYRAALAIYRETGDLLHQACALYDIGTVYQSTQFYDEALIHHQKAAAIAENLGDLHMQANAHLGAGDALCGAGSYAESLEHYKRARELSSESEDLHQKAKALAGAGEAAYRMHDIQKARIYWREAMDIFGGLGLSQAESLAIRLSSLTAE